MVGMGYRTIKTAIGAGIAMWLASLFNLEFATFAAIIVIMCIETTKKRTLHTIKDKLFASLLSLVLGAIVFELAGYHPVVFALFILFFMPILVKAKIQNGFVTSMVVLLHIYSIGEVSVEIFLDELLIIAIGMGIAILTNSVMPSFKEDINQHKYKVEEKFTKIFHEFHAFLQDKDRNWDGKEIKEAQGLINQAKSIVIQDIENHLYREKNKDYYYFNMRSEQIEIVKRMVTIVGIVASSEVHVKQKGMIADLFLYISKNVRSMNIDYSLDLLEAYEQSIREMELPKSRDEFEVRANLFYLNFEIKNYLTIKKKIMDQLGAKSKRSKEQEGEES